MVAAPALAHWCGQTDSIFAVATGGKVCCLDPRTVLIGEDEPLFDAVEQAVLSLRK